MSSFARLLRRLVKEFGGTKQELAQAIGVRPSQFSRFLSGAATPSLETCLCLAHVTHTSVTVVLRAAGRGDLAVLLEQLYGTPATYRRGSELKPVERRRLAQIRALDPAARKAFTVLLARHSPRVEAPVQSSKRRRRHAAA